MESLACVFLLASVVTGLPGEYESSEPLYGSLGVAHSQVYSAPALAPAPLVYSAPAPVQLAYAAPAIHAIPAPEEVVQTHSTHSVGPTQVREYHYHTQKVIPSHEVKTIQTQSTAAKKILHQHNQHEKVIHKHHHHENILREHNLHKIHLHNAHLQKHHVHLNNVHREHIIQPIYHQEEHKTVKVTEEHQTKNTEGESHEHRQSISESKSHAPAIYYKQHEQHGHVAAAPLAAVVAPLSTPALGYAHAAAGILTSAGRYGTNYGALL